jgi:hypothetical protein
LPIEDYSNVPNALHRGATKPPVPATVSFRIRWSGVKKKVSVRNADQRFEGRFIENRATIEWSASESGFTFASDPAPTTSNEFSEIGQERNGTFFSG